MQRPPSNNLCQPADRQGSQLIRVVRQASAGCAAWSALLPWCVSAACHTGAFALLAIQSGGLFLPPVSPGKTMLVSVALRASWAPPEKAAPILLESPLKASAASSEPPEPSASVEESRKVPAFRPLLASLEDRSQSPPVERPPTLPRPVADRTRENPRKPDPAEAPKPPAKQPSSFLSTIDSTASESPGSDRSLPKPFDNVPPTYPPEAVAKGFAGKVVFRARISTAGAVSRLTVAVSSGFSMLDEAAQAAIRLWRFHPARQSGQAVEATILIPIVFELSDSSSTAGLRQPASRPAQ